MKFNKEQIIKEIIKSNNFGMKLYIKFLEMSELIIENDKILNFNNNEKVSSDDFKEGFLSGVNTIVNIINCLWFFLNYKSILFVKIYKF